jgi:hypothetical protein
MRRTTGVQALVVGSGLTILLTACGGRVPLPKDVAYGALTTSPSATPSGGPTTSSGASATPPLPSLPSGAAPPPTRTVTPDPAVTSGDPTKQAIFTAYETYLFDLSGLDDTLSRDYIPPLAGVTTSRLAEASVRQAAALLNAHEHGVGTLRDDRISILMPNATTADIADCQDEYGFYPVEDANGTTDPFVQRGYFAGAAQLVFEGDHWLVDVFSTTHITCTF